MIKSILFCTDGSDYSNVACDYALWLAQKLGARIEALHVTDVRLLEAPLLADLSGAIGAQPYQAFAASIAGYAKTARQRHPQRGCRPFAIKPASSVRRCIARAAWWRTSPRRKRAPNWLYSARKVSTHSPSVSSLAPASSVSCDVRSSHVWSRRPNSGNCAMS